MSCDNMKKLFWFIRLVAFPAVFKGSRIGNFIDKEQIDINKEIINTGFKIASYVIIISQKYCLFFVIMQF